MEKELLEDIRALLLIRRAREIRINVGRADSEEDIEQVEINGKTHDVLTLNAALRIAVRDFQSDKAVISNLLKG